MSNDPGIAIKVQADANAARQTLRELVQSIKQSGREVSEQDRAAIRSAADRVKATRQVVKAHEDMGVVGVRSSRDIKAEIDRINAAMARLAKSSGTTGADLARAGQKAKERIAELNQELSATPSAIDKLKEVAGALAALAGMAVSFVVATKKAMEFEDALIDLRRAANLTKKEADDMAGPFKALAVELGLSASSVVGLATAAAKTGIAKKDLLDFARVASIAAMNFDMIPEEAGKSLALLKNVLKISVKDMEAYVATINVLADNAATNEAAIIETLMRGGSSGIQMGLTNKETAALATTILSLGASSEQAGTAIRTLSSRIRIAAGDSGKMGKALARVVGDTKKFQQALAVDAKGALLSFLTALKQMPNAERLNALVDIFGQGMDTENISKLADGVDILNKSFELAATSNEELITSLSQLTELKLGSTRSEVNKMSQAFDNATSAIGKLFLPAVRLTAIALQAVAQTVEKLVEIFPVFSRLAILGVSVAVAWGPLKLLFSTLAAVGLRIGSVFTYLWTASRTLVVGLTGLRVASIGVRAAFAGMLGPIGLVITAATLLYDAWQWFGKDSTTEGINKQAEMLDRVSETVNGVALAHEQARDVINGAVGDSTEQIKQLASNYKLASEDIKKTLADQITTITDGAKRAMEVVDSSTMSEQQKILETFRISSQAEADKVKVIEEAGRKMERAWEQTYAKSIALAQQAGIKVEDLDRDALDAKIAIYDLQEQALKRVLEAQLAEEQKYHQKAVALEEQRYLLRLSVEDRIRALKQKTMSEAQAYADRSAQIEEKIKLASSSAAAGNLEQTKRFAEEAMSMAERNAREVVENIQVNGEKATRVVVSEAQATQAAMDQLTRAHQVLDGAIQKTGSQYEAISQKSGGFADETQKKIDENKKGLDALQSKAAEGINTQINADATAAEGEVERLKQLAAASDAEVKLKASLTEATAAIEAWKQNPNHTELAVRALIKTEQLDADIVALQQKMADANLPVPAELKTEGIDEAVAEIEESLGGIETTSEHEVDDNVPAVKKEIDSLDGRNTSSVHTIYVQRVSTGGGDGYRGGGLIQAFASGGRAWKRIMGKIRGAGTGTSDSIRALVSNGEYILREKATSLLYRMFPGLLDRVNLASSPRALAEALSSALHGFAPPQIAMATGGLAKAPAMSGTSIGESMLVTFRAGDVESRVKIQDPASQMSMKAFAAELSRIKLVAGV